jgi:hypothetical protein
MSTPLADVIGLSNCEPSLGNERHHALYVVLGGNEYGSGYQDGTSG